jgi:hypothetical protein
MHGGDEGKHEAHKAELCDSNRMNASIGRGWLGLLVLVWKIQSTILYQPSVVAGSQDAPGNFHMTMRHMYAVNL